jgi:hypothetical protein
LNKNLEENKMTLIIPKSIAGRNAAEDYENVIQRTNSEPVVSAPKSQIIMPSEDLAFVTDGKMYGEIVEYLDRTFPSHTNVLSGKLEFADGVMKGSSPYIATAIDMYLKSINSSHRIATQRDLETSIQMFKGRYEDSGLALRSLKNPNKVQAGHLYNQLKSKNPNIEFPIFIDLRGLELDGNLNFNLTGESKYETAECLNWSSGTHYSQRDDFGLPSAKDPSSGRQIGTKSDGLVGLCLNGDLDLNSYYVGLAYSNDFGRVVLAKSR